MRVNIPSIIRFVFATSMVVGMTLEGVRAQMQVEPMIIETQTVKGKASGVIDITNTGDQVFQARVYSSPFTYNLDGFEELKTSPQDLTPYLVYSPRELTIQPGQRRRVRLNIRFLPSTLPGEYRAMIFTQKVINEKAMGTPQVGIIPRIGAAVYVRHGDVAPHLSVEKAIYQDKRIILRVNNAGKATALVGASWHLSQVGKDIATSETQPYTVIAEGQRNLELEPRELKPGAYQISGNLIWGKEEEHQLPFSTDLVVQAGKP